MLGYINFNCHILLSQLISPRFLPLHSLGNILIVYCSSDSIELGNSKQDVSLRNYRSQGMMEEQTEAEVTRNSHFCFFHRVDVHCFRLSSYSLFNLLPVLSLGPYSQPTRVSGRSPSCVAYFLVTIVLPRRRHTPVSSTPSPTNYSTNQRNIFPPRLHFFH